MYQFNLYETDNVIKTASTDVMGHKEHALIKLSQTAMR